jgi:PadR family transcriptional regulator, regulatory protein PadR
MVDARCLRAVDTMPQSSRPTSRIEILQGTLDLVILQTLRWGPQHGYGIAQMIRANSRHTLQVETGSLYPALHRIERKRWIASEWTVSEKQQRIKVYRLTPVGKKQLAAERSQWAQFSDAIADILASPKPERNR